MSGNRRALSAMSRDVTGGGVDVELSALLQKALSSAAKEDPRQLTHRFHTYAGRLHPAIARTLLAPHRGSGALVLDPFCGSGTVLVEARCNGLTALGSDLNPLAVRLASMTSFAPSAARRGALSRVAEDVVEAAKDRVRARKDARAPLTREQVRNYDGHVLKSLATLWEEIQRTKEEDRLLLEMVFSAIVIKFSRQRGDTGSQGARKRFGRFSAIEFFGRKVEELLAAWEELEADVPRDTPPPDIHACDVRRISEILDEKAAVILTSPPYGGTYDYVRHHSLRAAWLQLPQKDFADGELGARRRFSKASDNPAWDQEVGDMLTSMRQAIEEDGVVYLVVGDAQIGKKRTCARRQLQKLAAASRFEVVAWASSPRPDHRGGPRRSEHIVALRPVS